MEFERIQDKQNRFCLREFRESDLNELKRINEEIFFTFLCHGGPQKFLQLMLDTQKQNPRIDYFLAIAHPVEDYAIGFVAVHGYDKGRVEIAYFLSSRFQKKGIVRAAVALLFGALEDWNITSVWATVDPDNDASLAIMKALGFTTTGKTEMSRYYGDPKNPAHCDKHGKAMLRPRLTFDVDIDTLNKHFAKLGLI